jgi:glutathione S-transferase
MLSANSYILNMKGIPYKTEWVDYPDLADTLKKLGVGPTTVYGGVPFYTVPTIYDPNTKRAITDSQAIALYLDEQYPQGPRLFPPHTRALQLAQTAQFAPVLLQIFPMLVEDIHKIMTPYAQPYIRTTREAFLGCKIEDAAPTGEKRAQALGTLKARLDEMANAIKTNGEDALFFGGAEPVYADLFIAAILAPTEKIVGKEADLVQTIMAASGGHWARFLEYFKKYETVN